MTFLQFKSCKNYFIIVFRNKSSVFFRFAIRIPGVYDSSMRLDYQDRYKTTVKPGRTTMFNFFWAPGT